MEKKTLRFSVGDIVRIRSLEEILQTFDEGASLEGCLLTAQMSGYCGSECRVVKVVVGVFDEYEYRMFETKSPLYILEGMNCNGNVREFEHNCDRCCRLLWHGRWLVQAEKGVLMADHNPIPDVAGQCAGIGTDITRRGNVCQLKSYDGFTRKNNWLGNIFQLRVKILWWLKSWAVFLKNRLTRLFHAPERMPVDPMPEDVGIIPGDTVRVLKASEINKILDDENKYKGCRFIREMYQYCDKEFIVLKEVSFFFDEAKNKMCRCRGVFLLEGVVCSGERKAFSVPCDRGCFLFWHRHWLKKV